LYIIEKYLRSLEGLTILQIITLDWEGLLEPQGGPEGIHYKNRTHSNGNSLTGGRFETVDMLDTTVNGIAANLPIEPMHRR